MSSAGRRFPKGLSGFLPGPKAVALEGFKDPFLSLEAKSEDQNNERPAKHCHRRPHGSTSFGNSKGLELI